MNIIYKSFISSLLNKLLTEYRLLREKKSLKQRDFILPTVSIFVWFHAIPTACLPDAAA
jgi:hypothetical protein